MVRNVSVCILASVAVLLFSSDANACRRSRGWGCGGSGYSGMATGATVGTDTSGTATSPGVIGEPAPGVGVQPGVGVGRGYNPGGIGGPASGVGVRPGVGAGGLGRGR